MTVGIETKNHDDHEDGEHPATCVECYRYALATIVDYLADNVETRRHRQQRGQFMSTKPLRARKRALVQVAGIIREGWGTPS